MKKTLGHLAQRKRGEVKKIKVRPALYKDTDTCPGL